MTTMETDPLVDDYLRRLEAAAAHLQRARRAELDRGDPRAHREALRRGGPPTRRRAQCARAVGPPEEIVAAAGPAPVPERGRLELAALIVLSVSFIVPVIGYLIGARLVLASKVWDGRDKFLALLIPPVVVLGGAVVVMIGSASVADGDSFRLRAGPGRIAVLMANVFSGFAAASYLSARLRRTAAG